MTERNRNNVFGFSELENAIRSVIDELYEVSRAAELHGETDLVVNLNAKMYDMHDELEHLAVICFRAADHDFTSFSKKLFARLEEQS